MNLFESINNSLSNTVKNLSEEYLTEKKQKKEISPEDQKDNEIIRDVISKLRVSRYYRPTEEERKVLKKHGIDQYDDVLNTYAGSFDASENTLEHDHIASAGGWRDRRRDPSKINFADMSRKQEEREEYYNHYFNIPGRLMLSRPRVLRGAKKQKGRKNSISYDSTRNTQEIERNIENARLRTANDKYKGLVRDKKSELRYADNAYENADSRRKEILDEINKLRATLRDLDSKADALANEHRGRANEIQKAIDTHIDDKRKELQALKDRKRQKNESLLLEKKYIPTPEDERDDALIRSALKKMYLDNQDEVTQEEKDAIERCGYELRLDSGVIYPEYGRVDARGVFNPIHNRDNTDQNTTRVIDKLINVRDKDLHLVYDENGKAKKEIYPANVNLADLGRKRKERANKFSDYDDQPEYKRYRKKKYTNSWGEARYDSYNFENQLRDAQEYLMRKDHRDAKRALYNKKDILSDIDSAYNYNDERRRAIRSRIEELKRELAGLDNYTDAKVKNLLLGAKEQEKTYRDIIDAKKKNIEEKRKRREERNNGNK
jgi:hypothetical protein